MGRPTLSPLRQWAHHDVFFAVCIAAALVAPTVAVIQAWAHGWSPQGDDATIALRAQDVFSSRPPLLGMRSTTGDSGQPELASHHLGPLEFYLLAIPVLLTGGAGWAIAAGCVAIAATASVLTVVWARRLGGELGLLVFGTALLVTQWSIGPEGLYRPFNPYPAVVPTLLLLLLCWAIGRGDYRALPWLVGFGSLLLQANLAFVALGIALVVLMLVGLWRTRSRVEGRSADDRRQLIIAAIVGLVAWAPPVLDIFQSRPNNVQQLIKWVTQGEGGEQTGVLALRHLNLLAPLPGGFRATSPDFMLLGDPRLAWLGGAVLLLTGALALGLWKPRDRPGAVRPVRIAFVANLALLATATQMPRYPAAAYWLVHWLPVVAFTWAALVWFVLSHRSAIALSLPRRALAPAMAAAMAAACVLGAAAPRPSVGVDNAISSLAQGTRIQMGDGDGQPVVVVGLGFLPLLSATPATAYELRKAGWEPHFLTDWPFDEDASHLWRASAPEDSERILILDSTDPDLQAEIPEGAIPLARVEVPGEPGDITAYRLPRP